MGGVGLPELIVMLVIFAIIVVPLVVVVRVLSRSNAPSSPGIPLCRACHRPVSSRAAACPGCGYPLRV